MDIKKSIHFIGVAGSAMAPMAIALKEKGFEISGSDTKAYPPVSSLLQNSGMTLFHTYSALNLTVNPDLVVVGNAISRGNPELEEVLNRRIPFCSLPELVKETCLRGRKCIVVTGTHGKTTIASMLAWTLECAGFKPSFLIGGVPLNFPAGARITESDWVVIEGDEYDTAFFDKRSKFLHYTPYHVIINNIEFDHADIFPNLEAIQLSFKNLLKLVPGNGHAFVNGDDSNILMPIEAAPCLIERYGMSAKNDLICAIEDLTASGSDFTVNGKSFHISLPGEFNVRNAVSVIACARKCEIADFQIQAAFDSFKSTKRRIELCAHVAGVWVVDDFAHHPTAIRETIKALRVRYPGSRIWIAFEPRSNTTRRKVFQIELADALRYADAVTVGSVARASMIADVDRLDVGKLVKDLFSRGIKANQFDNTTDIAMHYVHSARPNDVFCAMSNGPFDGLVSKVIDGLKEKRVVPSREGGTTLPI